jgi:hypothetical protein
MKILTAVGLMHAIRDRFSKDKLCDEFGSLYNIYIGVVGSDDVPLNIDRVCLFFVAQLTHYIVEHLLDATGDWIPVAWLVATETDADKYAPFAQQSCDERNALVMLYCYIRPIVYASGP